MQYSLFYTTITVFYWKNKYSKVVNGDVHGTSTGRSCRTSRGPNDGRLWDVRWTLIIYVFNVQFRNILTYFDRLLKTLK